MPELYFVFLFQTIIECLKYMTTGLMPPGCSKGGAFIHDPKVSISLFGLISIQLCLYMLTLSTL